MHLYNTLSRRTEPVTPRDGAVSLYVCGITPYDVGHLGHALTYLTYDVLRRRLEHDGVRVRHVQNITDVDDDIIRKSRELNTTPAALARTNVAAFDRDMAALNALPANSYPTVSGSMARIVELVECLVESGHAYQSGGDVYFSIASFPGFGQLSRLDRAGMLAESERQKMRPGPRDPLDFLLWQARAEGEPAWESPWGEGRPGWHIECTAMATGALGATLDVHGGGADLIYPHHECEIAQSESVTGVHPFVRIWAHVGMLYYQGEKMSKSLGNMVFAKDLLRDHSSDAVRLALYSHHYRVPWEYTEAAIALGARQAALLRRALQAPSGAGTVLDIGSELTAAWAALDDDLNLPVTVARMVAAAEAVEAAAGEGANVAAGQQSLQSLTTVLGLTHGDC